MVVPSLLHLPHPSQPKWTLSGHSERGVCSSAPQNRLSITQFICLGCEAWGVLTPQPGIKPVLSMVEARNPNHWTVRKIPPAQSLTRWCLPWWWQTNQVSRSLWATEESDPGGVYTLWQKAWISIFVFWQSTPVFLPGKFHGPRSLVIHVMAKESDMTEDTPAHSTIWESITHWVARLILAPETCSDSTTVPAQWEVSLTVVGHAATEPWAVARELLP